MNLKDKNIKIDGRKFVVRDQFINRDENIETIILTRKIKGKSIKNIQDLGFKDFGKFKINDSQLLRARNLFLKSYINRSKLALVYVEEDGTLNRECVQPLGRDISDPENLIIQTLDTKETINVLETTLAKSIALDWIWTEADDGKQERKQETPRPRDIEEINGSEDLNDLMGARTLEEMDAILKKLLRRLDD